MLTFDLATSDEIERELGSRIRRQRLAQGLRQSELAARAGISELTLRNLERKGQGSLESFVKLVMTLGLAGELASLLQLKTRSIKNMEHASANRQRAPRKPQ